MEKNSKIVFITHPYYAVNNPNNNLRIYKKDKKDRWYYIQCKDINDYRKKIREYICGFYDYSRNENKGFSSLIDYYMGSKKTQSVMERNKMRREEMAMLKDGTFIKDSMVSKMKNDWSNYLENSNVQLGVLSLYQDYVDENIKIKDLQKEFTTILLPEFFKHCGYDEPKKNLEWIVSLHCDRENNYHFHIAWIEKNKSFKLRNKLDYRKKLHLSEEENNFMKRQISIAIERGKLYKPALIEINQNLDKMRSYFNPKDHNFTLKNISNLELEEDIENLGYLLSTIRDTNKKYIKYGSLPNNEVGKEIKFLTKQIKKKLFNNNMDLQLSKKEINNSIENLNNIFISIDKQNNISDVGFESAFDNKLIREKLEKNDNYILNAIVNHALYNYDKNKDSKISLNDMIGEIAINIYKSNYSQNHFKNKQKNRLRILENYFIYGKYSNYDKLSNALRRLSKDSEDAAKKFYEMLNNNELDNERGN